MNWKQQTPATLFRTQWAVFFAMALPLTGLTENTSWVMARVRGNPSPDILDVLTALGLDFLIVLFTFNARKDDQWIGAFAVLFGVGSSCINFLYYFPTENAWEIRDTFERASRILLSVLLPLGVAVCSHVVKMLADVTSNKPLKLVPALAVIPQPAIPTSTSYKCEYCEREFTSKESLGGHTGKCKHKPN